MLVARLSGVGYTTRRKLGGAVARLGSGRNRISPFPLRPFTLLSFISGGAWIVGGRKARALRGNLCLWLHVWMIIGEGPLSL
jgi:hypothetical protein